MACVTGNYNNQEQILLQGNFYNFKKSEITKETNPEKTICSFKGNEALVRDLLNHVCGINIVTFIISCVEEQNKPMPQSFDEDYIEDFDEDNIEDEDVDEDDFIDMCADDFCAEIEETETKKNKHCLFGTKCKKYPNCPFIHPAPCNKGKTCEYFGKGKCLFMH